MSTTNAWNATRHLLALALTVSALSACGAPESDPVDPAPTPPASEAGPAAASPAATDPATSTPTTDPGAAQLSGNGQPAASEAPDEAGQPEPRSDQEAPARR